MAKVKHTLFDNSHLFILCDVLTDWPWGKGRKTNERVRPAMSMGYWPKVKSHGVWLECHAVNRLGCVHRHFAILWKQSSKWSICMCAFGDGEIVDERLVMRRDSQSEACLLKSVISYRRPFAPVLCNGWDASNEQVNCCRNGCSGQAAKQTWQQIWQLLQLLFFHVRRCAGNTNTHTINHHHLQQTTIGSWSEQNGNIKRTEWRREKYLWSKLENWISSC